MLRAAVTACAQPILLLLPHEPLLLLPGNVAVGRWFWMPARAVPLVGWLEEDRGVFVRYMPTVSTNVLSKAETRKRFV